MSFSSGFPILPIIGTQPAETTNTAMLDPATASAAEPMKTERSSNSGFGGRFQGPTLGVVVGDPPRTYHLNKPLLASRSTYFRSLLSFPGVESTTNEVTLTSPVDDADAFELFVEYIYLDDYSAPSHDTATDCGLMHARLYVLAERLCIGALKELALAKLAKVLADLVEHPPTPSTMCPNGFSEAHHQIQHGHNRVQHSFRNGFKGFYCNCSHFGDSVKATRVRADVPLAEIVNMAEVVYANTPDRYQVKEVLTPTTAATTETAAATPRTMTPQPEDGTPDRHRTEDDESAVGETSQNQAADVPRDKMRVLLARFCASMLDRLRTDAGFRKVVRENGEFVEDLLMEVSNGKPFESDELSRL